MRKHNFGLIIVEVPYLFYVVTIKIALELKCGLEYWTLFQAWHLKFFQLNDRLQCNNNHCIIFYNCNLVIIVSLKLIITLLKCHNTTN